MVEKTNIIFKFQHIWRWSAVMGISATIFSLMLGLLFQTAFYEIVSNIPSLIRQDSHISLPLCTSFPDLYGCEPWVGKWTSLEILNLSLQVGQFGGLFLNLILVVIFAMWITIKVRSDSSLPGLLAGIIGGFSTLVLALAINVPISFHTLPGITGIVFIFLLPLGGLAGGILGKNQLTTQKLQRVMSFLPSEDPEHSDEIGERLSRRELEVLALVASGCKNNDIARQLYISKATVKTHLQHIFEKLGVKNRTAAVTKALAYGWLIREDEIMSN